MILMSFCSHFPIWLGEFPMSSLVMSSIKTRHLKNDVTELRVDKVIAAGPGKAWDVLLVGW